MPIERSEAQTRQVLTSLLEDVRALAASDRVNGVSDVGDHHRRLLEHYQDFVGALVDGYKSIESIDIIVREFVSFLEKHFSVEETIMSLLEYPDAEPHTATHRRFIDDIGHLLRMIPLGVKTYADFAIQVGRWLLNHEGTLDAELADYAARMIGESGCLMAADG